MSDHTIQLHGRIFLRCEIKLLTGLHIGGAAGGLEIGGVDKPVIRHPLTNRPYIPGSSLKGKLRSLMEKAYAAPQNYPINTVKIHTARSSDQYRQYPIASIFGTLPEVGGFLVPNPTRLIVRDVQLTPESEKQLHALKTDLPYTEIKWEAAIDRVTSAATPRQIERVPAGAVFGPAELIFSVYTGAGEQAAEVAGLFGRVIEALTYLEDDYLGGMGTRGNGQVQFTNLQISARRLTPEQYAAPIMYDTTFPTLAELDRGALQGWLAQQFGG